MWRQAPWETNHTRADAHIALGRALGRLGRLAEALDAAQAAIALNPNDPKTHLFDAWVLLKLNRLTEAGEVAKTALGLDPHDAAGYLASALISANFGRLEQATAIANRGAANARASPESEVLGAFAALTGSGDINHAITVVRNLADRTPDLRSEADFVLGGLLRERGDALEAAQHLRRAIDLGPDTSGKRIMLAFVLRDLGRSGEANGHLRKALQLNPIAEVSQEIRQTMARSEGRSPASVPLPDHLTGIGLVLPLQGDQAIRIAPDYRATCRYDRAIESVQRRRREFGTDIRLRTYVQDGQTAIGIQADMPREATGGRSPVRLSIAAVFDGNGEVGRVQVTDIVAPGLNERQKKRAATALSDRIGEVVRLRYAGGTYRQGGPFVKNASLLRSAYQRQFEVYDKGAQITSFEDNSRILGTTRRGTTTYYVIDTRLSGASFVAGADVVLEATGYMLIDTQSGLIAEQREKMVTRIVDRGVNVVESENRFDCEIAHTDTLPAAQQTVQAVDSRKQADTGRIAVIDAELIPINKPYLAKSVVNIRQAPRVNSNRLGTLQRGERVTAIARVRGYDWILVSRRGTKLGYVFYSLIEPVPEKAAVLPTPEPGPVPVRQQRNRPPTNHHGIAVIVGNRSYGGDIPPVEYAHNDADAMRAFVLDELGYRAGNVIDLRDATKAQLEGVFGTAGSHKGQLFDWLRPNRSDVVVYYSGHGVPGLESHRGYLLPVDGDPNRAELVGYSLDVMISNLKRLAARSITVYLDTCFSGSSHGGSLMTAASGLSITPKLPDGPEELTILTAAQADQIASWDNERGRGLFTHHLLEALGGAADRADFGNGDGNITVGEVKRYLDEEMTYQARRRFGRNQQANVAGREGAVLAVIR